MKGVMNMADIFVRKDLGIGWRSENELNSYQLLRDDATFQRTISSGRFLTRDGVVGYRDKLIGVPSGPVRIDGGAYHVRQYIYTEFIPTELLPYIEMRKTNSNIYFITNNNIFIDGAIIQDANRSAGLDIGTTTGVIHGFPLKSGKINITIIDASTPEIDLTTHQVKQLGKRIASIRININVSDPITDDEINTKYVGLNLSQFGVFSAINAGSNAGSTNTYYQQRLNHCYEYPQIYPETSFTIDNKTISKTISNAEYAMEYEDNFRSPFMYMPINSTIKIIIDPNKQVYDYLIEEAEKAYKRTRNWNKYSIPTKEVIFIIYKTDDVSKTRHLTNFPKDGVFRKKIAPGETFEYNVLLDKHTRIVCFNGGVQGYEGEAIHDWTDPFYSNLYEEIYR